MKTSLYSILCIVIRLGAVFAFVKGVASLPLVLGGLHSASDGAGQTGAAIALLSAMLILAFLLWLYPGFLARLASNRAAGEMFESPITPRQMQDVAFAVVGVYFATVALVTLVDTLLRVILTAQDTDYLSAFKFGGYSLTVYSVQFAIGLGLALGARGLSGWLARMRERGVPAMQPDAELPASRDDTPAG